MRILLDHNKLQFECETRAAQSLAITMDFDGPQPNHFGAAKASQSTLKLGTFVGDTEVGGSCNVERLEIIPHCNGTHTETISHIVNEDIWIGHAAQEAMLVAVLITVTPVKSARRPAAGADESYRPPLNPDDLVITAAMLTSATEQIPQFDRIQPAGLIIRTRPNTFEKRARAYSEQQPPPFLTVEAMQLIDRWNIQHLLVDFPSVDRMYDDGLLTNHHLFWHVKEKSHAVNQDSRQDRTITEMVFADDAIGDGVFVVNLQIPAFASDAAPSRPLLFPTTLRDSGPTP